MPTAAERSQAGGEAAVRSLVVFRLDGQRYALDLDRVERAIRVVAITPLPHAPAIVLGVIDLGGSVVPVIDVRSRFNRPPRALRLSDHLVVARTRRRTVALLVDETAGVIRSPAAACALASEILPGLELVEGAVKLEDGLVLIHDLDRLLALDERAALDSALAAAAGGA